MFIKRRKLNVPAPNLLRAAASNTWRAPPSWCCSSMEFGRRPLAVLIGAADVYAGETDEAVF